MNLTPTMASERNHFIDALRGIALLGIFLVNVPDMLRMESSSIYFIYTGIDSYFKIVLDLLMKTKFYTIFSFLYGYAFWLFLKRAEEKGRLGEKLFMKRSLILFAIGFVHALFLWEGDILHSYAVMGLGLLLFRKSKPKTIVIWASSLLAVYGVLGFIASQTIFDTKLVFSMEPYNVFSPYWANLVHRLTDDMVGSWMMMPLYVLELLPLFLFGLAAAKADLFGKLMKDRGLFKRMQMGSLLIGVILSVPIVYTFVFDENYATLKIVLFLMLAGKALAVFYILTFWQVFDRTKGRRWLEPFRAVGRMSLSNYLLQTVATLLLFSLTLANPTTLHLWQTVFYCLIFYSLQAAGSMLWLSKFQVGPVEWLLRRGTYGGKANIPIVRPIQQKKDRSIQH
ncbi:DUF418 domain-containing protein [Paenibacillus sp. GCM10027627]|uniref:DUF418 domain-containing protein n=1 Tax=unclassified Paenibacillus TaxID=185978 RepID=UPI0036357A76